MAGWDERLEAMKAGLKDAFLNKETLALTGFTAWVNKDPVSSVMAYVLGAEVHMLAKGGQLLLREVEQLRLDRAEHRKNVEQAQQQQDATAKLQQDQNLEWASMENRQQGEIGALEAKYSSAISAATPERQRELSAERDIERMSLQARHASEHGALESKQLLERAGLEAIQERARNELQERHGREQEKQQIKNQRTIG